MHIAYWALKTPSNGIANIHSRRNGRQTSKKLHDTHTNQPTPPTEEHKLFANIWRWRLKFLLCLFNVHLFHVVAFLAMLGIIMFYRIFWLLI